MKHAIVLTGMRRISENLAQKHGKEIIEANNLDDIWTHLGGFGKFQVFNMISIVCFTFLSAFSNLGFVMNNAALNHRCLIPECESENAIYESEEAWLLSAIPTDASGRYDSCLRYHLNHSTADPTDGNHTICSNATFSSRTFKCDRFVYDTDEWTIHREDWGINCDSDLYILRLIGTLNSAGSLCTVYAGYLQDRFGRKTVLLWASSLVAILGIIKSFSVSYVMMGTLEFLEAMVVFAMSTIPIVMAIEMVKPSHRVVVGAIQAMSYPTGAVIFATVQYLTFNWRNTVRTCYGFILLYIVLFHWTLDEPVRWLLNQKSYDDAICVIKRIARRNGVDYPKSTVDMLIAAESKKQVEEKCKLTDIKEIFKSSTLRRRFFACLWSGGIAVFVYISGSVVSVNLNTNKFLSFILTELVDIPSFIVACFIMNTIGRRVCACSFLIFSSCSYLMVVILPSGWNTMHLIVMLMGKIGAGAGTFVLVIYITELFPTFMRAIIVTAFYFTANLLCTLSPQLPALANYYSKLPTVVLGIATLLAALPILILPETLNKKLPDTIAEAEYLAKST